jgi:hypothetical protein
MHKQIISLKQISDQYGFLFIKDLPKIFRLGQKAFTVEEGITYSGTMKNELFYLNSMLMFIEFALNIVFESSMLFCSGIMLFCDC